MIQKTLPAAVTAFFPTLFGVAPSTMEKAALTRTESGNAHLAPRSTAELVLPGGELAQGQSIVVPRTLSHVEGAFYPIIEAPLPAGVDALPIIWQGDAAHTFTETGFYPALLRDGEEGTACGLLMEHGSAVLITQFEGPGRAAVNNGDGEPTMRVRPRLIFDDPRTVKRRKLVVPGLEDGAPPRKQLIYTDPTTIKRPQLIIEKGPKKKLRFIFPAE